MQHAGNDEIVNVPRLAGQQAGVLEPRDPGADVSRLFWRWVWLMQRCAALSMNAEALVIVQARSRETGLTREDT
jgi:hypothetical protein